MSEVIEEAFKQGSIVMVMDIVNEWESSDKSDFIQELLAFMTLEQVARVHTCLNYNTPLKGDHK